VFPVIATVAIKGLLSAGYCQRQCVAYSLIVADYTDEVKYKTQPVARFLKKGRM